MSSGEKNEMQLKLPERIKFSVIDDIEILKAVLAENPYQSRQTCGKKWKNIVAYLAKARNKNFPIQRLKGRLLVVLRDFKRDARNMNRHTGTLENYKERDKLTAELIALQERCKMSEHSDLLFDNSPDEEAIDPASVQLTEDHASDDEVYENDPLEDPVNHIPDETNKSIPVFKITINRELDNTGSGEKFVITPENFILTPDSSNASAPASSALPPSQISGTAQYMKCAVPSCCNYFDGSRTEFDGVSHFPFPRDPYIRNQWLTIINAQINPDVAKVCSAHFLSSDMYNTLSRGISLRANALPRKKLVKHMVIDSSAVSWLGLTGPGNDSFPKISSIQSMSEEPEVFHLHSGETMMGIDSSNRIMSSALLSLDETVNPEEGLINIPATIKKPPRLSSVNVNQGSAVTDCPLNGDRNPSNACNLKGKSPKWNSPGPLLAGDNILPSKRKRSKKDDSDNDDEWVPADFVKRNQSSQKKSCRSDLSSDSDTNDDDELLGTSLNNSDNDSGTSSCPGPASKSNRRGEKNSVSTSKPDWTPDLSCLSDSSLLVDWSFFKSLLPYMGKMTVNQRYSLKGFILHILNEAVYNGKPIKLPK